MPRSQVTIQITSESKTTALCALPMVETLYEGRLARPGVWLPEQVIDPTVYLHALPRSGPLGPDPLPGKRRENLHVNTRVIGSPPNRDPPSEKKDVVMDIKRITTLCLIVLADMSGAMAIIPIIPVFVLGQFHATPFQVALVIAACIWVYAAFSRKRAAL